MSANQQLLYSYKLASSSAIAFVAGVSAGSSTGNSVTTGAVTTPATGNHFVFAVAYDDFGGVPSISDNYANSWTSGGSPLTVRSGSAIVKQRIYFCENGVGGAGHTFTATGSFNYPTIAIGWWSGVKTSSSFDQEAGAGAAAVTSQDMGGNTTPSVSGELVVTSLSLNNTATPTTPTGYSSASGTAGDAANHIGCFLAYIIQTNASAENPNWTWTGSTIAAGALGCFKPA